ncbi:MAG TPA: Crp/Fnr family transcriptional regulator [Pyrinomonadaceae bacterium]|nr:Crp/Fnr family transcriptional regulator [Pyrinomonadaceae bacterium]
MSSPKELGNKPGNHLLSALPREESARLSRHLELVRLVPGKILYNAGDVVRHAYFPRAGMVCLLSATESGRTIEVAMIGDEGMVGVPIILRSVSAPYHVMVQLAGDALRIRGGTLREEFDRGGRLQDLLLRYMHTLLVQIAQSAACNGFHTVEERLCRWLLVCRDRVQSDTIPLTQEFLAHMLGVPRTTVTMVARAVQKKGLIGYSRGKVTILDRRRLEAASCECYKLVHKGAAEFLVA